MRHISRFAAYTASVLMYTTLVILWGAFVRATGSGAGCGSHWPACNGQIIPMARSIETLIEFSHRVSSSLLGLLMIGLVVWAVRAFPRGHSVRRGAGTALFFTIMEGLVGAVQVKLELTAQNPSLARAIWQSIHLANTFLLVAAVTLTLWWAVGGGRLNIRGQGLVAWLLGIGLVGAVLLGATGAITALGDTLFPAESLRAGIMQDFSPAAHFLIRLRIIHPLLAIGLGVFLVVSAAIIRRRRPGRTTERMARALIILFFVQLGVGALNVVLLAPTVMQLVHLLLADLVWIALVLLSAAALAQEQPENAAVPVRPLVPQRQ